MKRYRGSILVWILTVFLAGCSGSSGHDPKSGNQGSGSGAAQPVNVAAVESQKLNTTVSLPAQITAYQSVDIYPKVSGYIESIRVDRGSHVRQGEVIVRLSAPEVKAQRAQAESHLHAAEAQLASMQAKLDSDQGTYQHLSEAAKVPGVVADNDVSVAEQNVAADRAQVEAASNNVSAAREALRGVTQLEDYLNIRAPFDGVVTVRNFHDGALVGPSSGQTQMPIVQILDLRRLRLIVPVPEMYVASVREGQEVSFTVPEYPGRSFKAPIARIAHDVDQSTRTMQVEVEVKNVANDTQITPGVFATVEWPVQRSYPTLFVPSTAVATDLQRSFVVRVRDGKADWVDVKTGVTVNGKIEVFGDLHPNDQVAARGTDELRPGTSVEAHLTH